MVPAAFGYAAITLTRSIRSCTLRTSLRGWPHDKGELIIGFTVACWETGWDVAHTDDHVIRGETMEELQTKAVKHVKEVHGATDEQLNNPATIETFKAAVKQD